ncbi:hypothetical protein I6F35_20060 [Bradyrhizobium sp. BRP22]|uniref:hypothetical protein n=1 Tax=Bradyrhizobium sp. BRP22 TaxID=2793821 RepID=UPI001CD52705|nr:hypothetical protein [Bradyrhizobium sp. BRP22]MCA1455483.1 hypothetical protein [Bradyrhizobium sp. BRP22]
MAVTLHVCISCRAEQTLGERLRAPASRRVEDAPQFDRCATAGCFMSAVALNSWCPRLLRPMPPGDRVVLRVRPYGGSLDRVEAAGVPNLAECYVDELTDVTSRANLQIRGVSDRGAIVDCFAPLNLLECDPESESRRKIVMMPKWASSERGTMGGERVTRSADGNETDCPHFAAVLVHGKGPRMDSIE